MIKKNLYIGWDIGGAHTKYTAAFESKDIIECRILHCELWKSLSKLEDIIQNVSSKYKKKFNIINLITMSAEMCDIFPSRVKGVKSILSLFKKRDFINHVYSKDNKILKLEGFKKYLSCESTNWMVIADYLNDIDKNMIAIDIGSTTTDLVLVKDHICVNKRYDDYSGLNTEELLYTGALRTPIYSVTNSIILNKKTYNVIPENFSTMSDIYRLLNIIKNKSDYTNTADGRSKSIKDTLHRISRVFGFDYTASKNITIIMLSRKIMSMHVDQISYTIKNHIKNNFSNAKNLKIIGMGVGRNIIEIICTKNKWKYISLDKYINIKYNEQLCNPSDAAPSCLLSLLLKKYYE